MEANQFPGEVSLCLSGGAARGAFHLGAISVLEKNGIKIKAVSGTSIGALIGASLACGKKSEEILQVLKSREFKKVFKLSIGGGYIFKIDTKSKIIDSIIDKSSFEELSVLLDVSVTDVDNAEALYFNSGNKLKELVLASCSISPLIKPVEIDKKLLIDGGLIDNFPVERLKKYPFPIVGINLYPNDKKRVSSIFGWIKKIIFVSWQAQNLGKRHLCDIYVSSDTLNGLSSLSLRDVDKAYKLGVTEMNNIINSYM